jgi:hypothetical protein
LPSDPSSPGINGAWGPKGFIKFGDYNGILYNLLGNAHHVMLKETYLKFFPLFGSAGSCESFMNNKMFELGIKNVELQAPIYFFHSHKLNYPIKNIPKTSEWNRSGDGFEYGISDMHEYLKSKKPILCDSWLNYPNQKHEFLAEDYYYD